MADAADNGNFPIGVGAQNGAGLRVIMKLAHDHFSIRIDYGITEGTRADLR